MSWDKAIAVALILAGAHRVRYRVYSVRQSTSGRWRYFICPVEGR